MTAARRVWGLVAWAALVSPAASAGDGDETDSVRLVEGKVLTGRVVYEDEKILILRTRTKEQELAQQDIESIDSVTRHLHAALNNMEKLHPTDTAGLLDVARFCASHRLPGEAHLLYLLAVLTDPGQAEANAVLGHRERGGTWRVRRDHKWHPTSQLADLGEAWDQRWALSTTHYEIQVNLCLREAVEVAIDLERTYRAFFELLARDLRLLDIEEKMLVHVHGDDASYPEPGDRRPGFFDPSSLTLTVNATRGLPRHVLVHEATHQLLYMTTQRTRRARGQIPGWLDEGLANYLSEASRGKPGRLTLQIGAQSYYYFRLHAKADDPYKLTRLLTMDAGDFMASNGAELKHAQSYTLVHFLLHGGGSHHHMAFFDLLRRAYAGGSSMSDFKKAIGVRLRDFERDWQTYVQETASLWE